MFVPRDVINIWDKFTRPEKPKIHICVCPIKQLFLRINSEPKFPPHHLLRHGQNASILTHDSYVELNRLLRNRAYEISKATLRGQISISECALLVATVYDVETLNEEEKEFIDTQLS